MARINKSPKVSFRETDLTSVFRKLFFGNGRKTTSYNSDTFISGDSTVSSGEVSEPTTTTTTTEEQTTTTTTIIEETTTTTTLAPTTTTTTTAEPTTTTTTIDYTVIPYRIIISRNVQSFPGSALPSSYIFDLKDSNGDFVYSDYDIKCIVESIPNGGYGSWTIGVENNSDEYLSVGDSDLVRFSFAGTEVVGPFNQSTRGYYIDTEMRFGNTIDKYIINIVDGEVISIVSFDSIGDVSDCNLPTTTTTTTTVAPTTTTTTTEEPTTTTTTTIDDGLTHFFMSEPVLTEQELCDMSFNLQVKHISPGGNNWNMDSVKNMDGSNYYLPTDNEDYWVVIARADLSPELYNEPVSSVDNAPVSPWVYINKVRLRNYSTIGAKGQGAYGWLGSDCPTTTTTTTSEPTTTTTTIDYTSIVYNLVNGVSDDTGLLRNFEDMSYSNQQVKCLYNDFIGNSGSVLTISQTNTLDGYISVGDDEFTLNGNPINNFRGVFTDTNGIMGTPGDKYIITFTNGVVTSINNFNDLGVCPTYTLTTESSSIGPSETVKYMINTTGVADSTTVNLVVDQGVNPITGSGEISLHTLTITNNYAEHTQSLYQFIGITTPLTINGTLQTLDSNGDSTGNASVDTYVYNLTGINHLGSINGNSLVNQGYDYDDYNSLLCSGFNSTNTETIMTSGSDDISLGDVLFSYGGSSRLSNYTGVFTIETGFGAVFVPSNYYFFETDVDGVVITKTQLDCSLTTTTTQSPTTTTTTTI